MAVTRFAAVDIGAYNVQLKIFEITKEKGIVKIDNLKKEMELGSEVYRTGKLSFKTIEELCQVLYEFLMVIKGYKITNYAIGATSGIRSASNINTILDRIKVRTGFEVKVLSNSEQRFLSFKAVIACESRFAEVTNKPSAIVEVGSTSTQISIFEDGVLIATNNIRLGSIRIRELISGLSEDSSHTDALIEELLMNDLQTLTRLYLKDTKVENVIVIGEILAADVRKNLPNYKNTIYSATEFLSYSTKAPCMKIYKKIVETFKAKNVIISDVDMCDAMAADFALDNKKIKVAHNFDNDILEEARNICKRYNGSTKHITLLCEHTDEIFDMMKKYHGLNQRDKLMLSIAAILHDCGKYVSMRYAAECSYNIVMSTEIIGLSHKERELVANVVKYNTTEIGDARELGISNEDYLKIVKLVAILRVSNAMDRSHKQKYKNHKIEIKGNELHIIANTEDDITLESSLFKDKADFFEEVYGIKPILRKKKGM